jgi:acyl dehydratase
MADIERREDRRKPGDGAIRDEDIERQRKLIGYEEAVSSSGQFEMASVDSIREFARGCGNDNPLFTDPEYAAGTRWGGLIAPAMMARVINAPMRGDPLPVELAKLPSPVFKGVRGFESGSRWDWYRPICSGDTLFSFTGLESCDVWESERSGRSVVNVRRDVKVNQRAEVVAVYRVMHVLVEHAAAIEKSVDVGSPTILRADPVAPGGELRGRDERYFEDVRLGDDLGRMIRRPVPVSAGCDARAMCESHAYEFLVNWAGDDAIVLQVREDSGRLPDPRRGLTVTGEVTGKREEAGRRLIDVVVRLVERPGQVPAKVAATLALPGRGRPALYDEVPRDLAQRAVRMMSRHWELARG